MPDVHIRKKTLLRLVKDEDRSVKIELTKHPNTNEQTLSVLANDRDQSVKIAVAENPNSSDWTLLELLRDRDNEVSSAAFGNPSVGIRILSKLDGKKHMSFREKALKKLRELKLFVISKK